jgi:hypothetical protein
MRALVEMNGKQVGQLVLGGKYMYEEKYNFV